MKQRFEFLFLSAVNLFRRITDPIGTVYISAYAANGIAVSIVCRSVDMVGSGEATSTCRPTLSVGR